MLALMGHMSRSMLERYSHIRMNAKREAVEALTITKAERNSEGLPTIDKASETDYAVTARKEVMSAEGIEPSTY